MRAAVFHGSSRNLTVETVPDPAPKAGHVVIEVARAGICGSDLHMAEHDFAAPGTIFGHEFSGTIAAIGPDVSPGYKIGDRVTANPFDACRQCEPCADGHFALCSGGRCIGTLADLPGAYAEYVSVPAHGLQRLPSGASFEEGALVEPLAVAYHAVRLAALGADDTVLILGAGPIGLAVALMCRQYGIAALGVSEPSEARRIRATDFGATALIDPLAGDPHEQVTRAFGGRPSVVIECVGNAGRIQDALNFVAPRGRIIIPGACMTEDQFHPAIGLMKEARLQFSMTYTESDFESVVNLVSTRKIDPISLHTLSVSLDETPETFSSLKYDHSQVKAMIDFSLQ